MDLKGRQKEMANESDTLISGEFSPEKILDLLQSRQKSEREQGLQTIQNLLKISTEESHSHDPALVVRCSSTLSGVQELIVQTLQNVSPEEFQAVEDNGVEDVSCNGEGVWGAKHGCLSASLAIILRTANSTSEENRQFLNNLQQLTLRLICDQDVRVRLLAGKYFILLNN